MPKDNIERAIKKGCGDQDGVNYSELTYEAYGPGGVALLIQILTDNKNRTAAEVRNILTKGGGNLGESGCVSYLFKRKGIIAFDASKYKEDNILDVALEVGAEDISTEDGIIEVICEPDDFEKILDSLTQAGFENTLAEISMIPDSTVSLDQDKSQKAVNLIEALEDNDDIQSVATNLELPVT